MYELKNKENVHILLINTTSITKRDLMPSIPSSHLLLMTFVIIKWFGMHWSYTVIPANDLAASRRDVRAVLQAVLSRVVRCPNVIIDGHEQKCVLETQEYRADWNVRLCKFLVGISISNCQLQNYRADSSLMMTGARDQHWQGKL